MTSNTVDDSCNKFIHPFTGLICGPTGSGKSVFISRLLESDLLSPYPEKILLIYGQYQDAYEKLKQTIPMIEFSEGMTDEIDQVWMNNPARKLILIDDCMETAASDKRVAKFFTQGSHHKNLSCILVLQNMFYQGSQMRTISLNSHYIVLFKNPRDQQQVRTFSRQMYPSKPKILQQAYTDSTKQPYGYLVLNLKPNTAENCRLLTNIFNSDGYTVVYVPKFV